MSLYPRASVALTLHEESLSLQQLQIIATTQNHNQSKCRVWSPVLWINLSRNTNLKKKKKNALKAQETLRKMGRKDFKSQIRDFAVRLCLSVTSDATHIKPPHHNHPKMGWTRTVSMDRPKWTGKLPWALHKELQAANGCGTGEILFLREECTTACPIPNDYPWRKKNLQVTLYRLDRYV